ncbi:hypothetical protein LZC95_32565 [Pendulispora brunnea]|uniref:Knr4/Smi1-like domain-containing protein n=1 Tax=Pendulispora brunnea TaxID=2905690 RepID=A0ABZ2K1W3_9BACT
MIATERSDDISDFIAFFEQIVGRDVASDRMGADPKDIERLVQLVGFPLPEMYLGSLREFGERDGVLKPADDASPKPSALVEFYLEQADSEESEVPDNGVVFGVNGSSGERAFLYSDGSKET